MRYKGQGRVRRALGCLWPGRRRFAEDKAHFLLLQMKALHACAFSCSSQVPRRRGKGEGGGTVKAVGSG